MPDATMGIVTQVSEFSGATYTDSPSNNSIGALTRVIEVYRAGEMIFHADPARVVSSDAPGDCTSLLKVEYVPMCGFSCGTYCSPVKAA